MYVSLYKYVGLCNIRAEYYSAEPAITNVEKYKGVQIRRSYSTVILYCI